MNKLMPLIPLAAASILCTTTAQADTTLVQALGEGTTGLNFRLRYEDVSWDGLEDASALTLRTRLTYSSGDFQGWGLALEFDDVRELDSVDYRTAGNDPMNSGAVIIADPEGTEVNQAFIRYQWGDTQARLGRQRILLDNQRFVGGVGWRQNEQTYDAFSITDKSVQDTTIFYAYLDNVNRIFGELNPIGDHRHDSHLLNVKYDGLSFGALTGYAYLLDNESAPGLSSDTLGVRWQGVINPQLSYTLEYATQSDAGDNPMSYSADYLLAEGAVKLGQFTVKLGYELLGSDGGAAAFATPLATAHAFQGWTDRFLETPAAGIENIYFTAGTAIAGVNVMVMVHDFSSDEGSVSYGQEFAFSAAKRVGPVGLLLKYADYQADDFGSDTRKLWLQAEASF
ncbi:alginate export family protein [Marinimicrobium alkaliphilum]|uniref:alginate export family protein n=1 Tax=Marinimicrobium alkaliphilum TaxID=2202654 RepID=UPI001E3C5DE3|nr:alginate export family protein [Marinimicrobium alkaliphilum]